MSQMVAETIGQGSPPVTAEVGAEAASSQKQEVTVPTPSQGKSQPMHAKPAPDASPGDNPSPQVTGQSSAQATTSDKRHEDATSALPSHSRNFFVASGDASQPLPQKHATPESVADTALNGESFVGSVRPNVLSQDYTGAEWKDPDVDMLLQLSNATDTHTHHSNRAQLLGPVAKWFSSMGLSLQHPHTSQWSGLSPQRATTEARRCATLAALGTLETPGRTHWEFASQLVGPDSRAAKIDFQMALSVARLSVAEMEVAKASHCTGTNAQVGASGTRPLQQAQIRHVYHSRWQAETHPVRYT